MADLLAGTASKPRDLLAPIGRDLLAATTSNVSPQPAVNGGSISEGRPPLHATPAPLPPVAEGVQLPAQAFEGFGGGVRPSGGATESFDLPKPPKETIAQEAIGRLQAAAAAADRGIVSGLTLGYVDLYDVLPGFRELEQKYIKPGIKIKESDPILTKMRKSIEKNPAIIAQIPANVLGALISIGGISKGVAKALGNPKTYLQLIRQAGLTGGIHGGARATEAPTLSLEGLGERVKNAATDAAIFAGTTAAIGGAYKIIRKFRNLRRTGAVETLKEELYKHFIDRNGLERNPENLSKVDFILAKASESKGGLEGASLKDIRNSIKAVRKATATAAKASQESAEVLRQAKIQDARVQGLIEPAPPAVPPTTIQPQQQISATGAIPLVTPQVTKPPPPVQPPAQIPPVLPTATPNVASIKELAEAPVKEGTVIQFIRVQGGIKPTDKLIKDFRLAAETKQPGVFSKTGLSIDAMREAAVEAGMLPSNSTESDFINLVESDRRSKRGVTKEFPDRPAEDPKIKEVLTGDANLQKGDSFSIADEKFKVVSADAEKVVVKDGVKRILDPVFDRVPIDGGIDGIKRGGKPQKTVEELRKQRPPTQTGMFAEATDVEIKRVADAMKDLSTLRQMRTTATAPEKRLNLDKMIFKAQDSVRKAKLKVGTHGEELKENQTILTRPPVDLLSVKPAGSATAVVSQPKTIVIVHPPQKPPLTGEGSAPPGKPPDPPITEETLNAEYEVIKDSWLGEKDWQAQKASVEATNQQELIIATTGERKFGKLSKDVDKAIQIYIDLKRNPAHLEKYFDKLNPAQQNIVRLSQALTPEQTSIADEIASQAQGLGVQAKEADIIQNTLDNYVGRVWDVKQPKKGSHQFRKFGTTTRHAKARKFDTILEGWANGFNLKVEGATNNLSILKEEIHNTIQDKKFIGELTKLKNLDGKPFVSPIQQEGMVRVEHPNFRVWRFAGKAEPSEEIVRGKNFIQTPEGTILERKDLYAPKEIATELNNIMGVSKLKGIPAIDAITKYNDIIKAWVLQSSLFHHLAFMRSYYLGSSPFGEAISKAKSGEGFVESIKGLTPRQSYKSGQKAIKELTPEIELLVRNGLTLGRIQDWEENTLLQQDTFVGRTLDKLKATKEIKDAVNNFRAAQASFLFKQLGSGLKAKAALIELRNILKKYPTMNPNKAAKIAANLINDDFGGLNLKRIGRNPTVQHIFKIFALAPDWCVDSKTRAMTKTGWKFYNELTVGKDEILAFNPDTQKYQWLKTNDIYINKKFDSDVVIINNHNRKIVMTPEHKCYVYNNSKKKHEVVLAKNLNTAHSIPAYASFKAPVKESFSNEFVHLAGWVVTDGYFKKNRNKLANGKEKTYLYAKVVQAKPYMVEHLKSLGLKYSMDSSMKEHDGIVCNYPKHTFNIPLELNNIMLKEKLNNGLSWNFLSKLTKNQLGILYDAMMMGDGTGQNRFCGKENEVFFMTMVQTMLGLPSTFYQQDKNCWRTRIVMRKNIGCQNKKYEQFKGTIWCPSVDTGFWLAEREGLMFITGNTESNIRSFVKAFERGAEGEVYRRFWARIITKSMLATLAANAILHSKDDKPQVFKKAWESGKLRWLDVDITPIYKAFGGETPARKYFSIIGHFKDPLKFALFPIKSAHYKGSIIYSALFEAITGEDWAGREFTELPELLATGATVRPAFTFVGRPNKYSQVPSYLLSQLKGSQPIQVQQLLNWWAGETEAFDAIGQSLGLGIRTTFTVSADKKAKDKKIRKIIKGIKNH